MRQRHAIVLAAAAAALVAAMSWRATRPAPAPPAADDAPFAAAVAPPSPRATPAPDGAAGPLQETEWFALVPRDWEPARTFGDDIARLNDNDPRAMAALARLRAAWADAPVEPAMDGRRIRIGGFVIPLDSDRGAVTEFLLVPYFGACIHAPPPPANQVIHVFPREPVRGMTMMQAVRVDGTIALARDRSPDSAAGLVETIGYDMRAQAVTPYDAR